MDQALMKKFQVIGLCASTQIISWDQETKLWDGVPFDINFSQDFSVACIDGRALTGIPMDEVFRALLNPLSAPALSPVLPLSFEEQERSRMFWADIEKQEKKERKRKLKWKRKHPKPSSPEEAEENFDRILNDLGVQENE